MGDIIQFEKASQLLYDGDHVFTEIYFSKEELEIIYKSIRHQKNAFTLRFKDIVFILELIQESISNLFKDIDSGEIVETDVYPLLMHIYELYFLKSAIVMEYNEFSNEKLQIVSNKIFNREKELTGGKNYRKSDYERYEAVLIEWATLHKQSKT